MTDYEKLKEVLEEIGVGEVTCNSWEHSAYSDIQIGDDNKNIEFNFENGKFTYYIISAEYYAW